MQPPTDFFPQRDFGFERNKFDRDIGEFLHGWLQTAPLPQRLIVKHFTRKKQPDLLGFFKNTPSPLRTLLQCTGLADYLCRPIEHVEFKGLAPVFSACEERIYNLADRYDTAVPYRNMRPKNQSPDGSSILPKPGEEHIKHYFATRRVTPPAAKMLTARLRTAVDEPHGDLPVHVMSDRGQAITECLLAAADHLKQQKPGLRCYLIQQRHGLHGDERHFGTLLVIAEPAVPAVTGLRRVIYADNTIDPELEETRHFMFEQAVKTAFRHADAKLPADMCEDASLDIARPDEALAADECDIDCAIHTFAMARALGEIANQQPGVLLEDNLGEVRRAMMLRIPEYFAAPNLPHHPMQRQIAGLEYRWGIGRDYLNSLLPLPQAGSGPASQVT